MRKYTHSPSNIPLSGELLVSDFLAALTNRIAAETARQAAEQSEKDTLQSLAAAGAAHGSGYLAPGDIPAGLQDTLVRSSVDAHVKKVQAEQVKMLATNQLTQMQYTNEAAYLGRKVQITIIDRSFTPVESYWVNAQTGQEYIGTVTKTSIKGSIQTIALDKNLLIIEPSFGSKLFNPSRKYFLVYVINPHTLAPAVQINLL